MCVGHVFLVFFFIIWGFLRFIFRTLYDSCMFVVIYLLGRVPETNSCIAWKIGGPGISRDYYYSMEMEEVYLLFRQYLEDF